jgi:hypothetical protein
MPTAVVANELIKVNLSVNPLASGVLELSLEDAVLLDTEVLCGSVERHVEGSIFMDACVDSLKVRESKTRN